MFLLWATTATGRPKIETGSSIGEHNNTLKQATLNATTEKKENKGVLSLTQQDVPFQDSGAPVTAQVCFAGPQFTSCS